MRETPAPALRGPANRACSESDEIVLVVGKCETHRDRRGRAGDFERLRPIRLEHDLLFGAEKLVGTENRPRAPGVLRRHHIGMRAIRFVPREFEHLRSERRQDRRRRFSRRHRHVLSRLHPAEILAHRRHRLPIDVSANILDQQPMRNSDSEQESPVALFGKGQLRRLHGHRVACIDIRDPRRDDESTRMIEQPGCEDERVAPARVREPERRITHLLDSLSELDRLVARESIRVEPDPAAIQIHLVSLCPDAGPIQRDKAPATLRRLPAPRQPTAYPRRLCARGPSRILRSPSGSRLPARA